MYRTLRHPLRKSFRPLCAWVSALLYLLVVSGLPLPVISAPGGKDRSRPFPCMDSQCGCHTAEQCWQSCCCHSLNERISWAKRQGIEVPAEAVARACAIEGQSPEHCSPERRSAGRETTEVALAGCCEGEPSRPADRPARTTELGSIVLIQALACQGGLSFWLEVAEAVTVPLPEASGTQLPPHWFREAPPLISLSHGDAPPCRPPRAQVA